MFQVNEIHFRCFALILTKTAGKVVGMRGFLK